jgi:hypothetical protein
MTWHLDVVAPLFVPAHRPDWFEKVRVSAADAVIGVIIAGLGRMRGAK